MSAFSRTERLLFVTACATAGALAVPLHPLATGACAALAGLIGLLGLRVWLWSHLPTNTRGEPGAARQLVEGGLWIVLGLAMGLLLLGIIRYAIEPVLPAIGARIAAAGRLPVWRRLLIIYVAAVGEELVFRLILVSAIVGLAVRFGRPRTLHPTSVQLWTAIGLAAFAFAAAHLPAWLGAAPIGVWLATSVLMLNAVAGLALGYVFVSRGIVAAILMHAGGDCAIQLIGPLTS